MLGASAGAVTYRQNCFTLKHAYTETKPSQRQLQGIKMLFLIMTGNEYKLCLQNFSSALLANHLFSRGDITTYATASCPCALEVNHALSHLRE